MLSRDLAVEANGLNFEKVKLRWVHEDKLISHWLWNRHGHRLNFVSDNLSWQTLDDGPVLGSSLISILHGIKTADAWHRVHAWLAKSQNGSLC